MQIDQKTTAFLFPGQGSQYPGMGKELAQEYKIARETMEAADTLLGFSLSELMINGPKEELNETVNTQPALYLHSIAAQRVLAELFSDFSPAFVAGHSLGELSALTAAGALAFEDGLKLVRKRGELMKRAGDLSPGGMAAILGLDIDRLESVCEQASDQGEIVQVANDNCPGQVVISGAKGAVNRAIEEAKRAGAKRAVPLAVSIAAHSPLMGSIQDEWNQAVDACSISNPEIPVIGNVTAEAMTSADELRSDIKNQMRSPVRWTESIKELSHKGIQYFVEVGSGTVLLGLLRRIEPGATGYPIGNPADLENFNNIFRKH